MRPGFARRREGERASARPPSSSSADPQTTAGRVSLSQARRLTSEFLARLRPPEACVRTLVERRDGDIPRNSFHFVAIAEGMRNYGQLDSVDVVETPPAACENLLGEYVVVFAGLTSFPLAADPLFGSRLSPPARRQQRGVVSRPSRNLNVKQGPCFSTPHADLKGHDLLQTPSRRRHAGGPSAKDATRVGHPPLLPSLPRRRAAVTPIFGPFYAGPEPPEARVGYSSVYEAVHSEVPPERAARCIPRNLNVKQDGSERTRPLGPLPSNHWSTKRR
ncbi:uncharacterized protein SCHCODRAFT_01349547 [Schizophyllum commune H4-8]|nr:uncharacterized protein SCHCODRAFT_01349547 [Schizophyllum commune H4-8]KAI5895646.1 hypothetical protein SCHCODRAFT_01349547 [Schizophyllum commune H4-8]